MSSRAATQIPARGDTRPPILVGTRALPPNEDSTKKFSDFVAQGVVGLQTTYLFTDNIGFYSAIDYRAGDEADFKKSGDKYGSLKMNGWYASAGLVLQF